MLLYENPVICFGTLFICYNGGVCGVNATNASLPNATILDDVGEIAVPQEMLTTATTTTTPKNGTVFVVPLFIALPCSCPDGTSGMYCEGVTSSSASMPNKKGNVEPLWALLVLLPLVVGGFLAFNRRGEKGSASLHTPDAYGLPANGVGAKNFDMQAFEVDEFAVTIHTLSAGEDLPQLENTAIDFSTKPLQSFYYPGGDADAAASMPAFAPPPPAAAASPSPATLAVPPLQSDFYSSPRFTIHEEDTLHTLRFKSIRKLNPAFAFDDEDDEGEYDEVGGEPDRHMVLPMSQSAPGASDGGQIPSFQRHSIPSRDNLFGQGDAPREAYLPGFQPMQLREGRRPSLIATLEKKNSLDVLDVGTPAPNSPAMIQPLTVLRMPSLAEVGRSDSYSEAFKPSASDVAVRPPPPVSLSQVGRNPSYADALDINASPVPMREKHGAKQGVNGRTLATRSLATRSVFFPEADRAALVAEANSDRRTVSFAGSNVTPLRKTALARQQKAKSLFLTDANDITSEASTDLRAAKVQSIVFPDADRQTMDSEATSDGLPLQSSYKEGLYFPEGPPLSAASSHQDAASSATAAYQSHPEFGLTLEPDDSNVSTAGHHGNINTPSSDPPDAVIDAFEVWLSERGEIVPPDDEDDNYMDTAGGPPDRTRRGVPEWWDGEDDEYMALDSDAIKAERARRGLPEEWVGDYGDYLGLDGVPSDQTRRGIPEWNDGDEYMAMDGASPLDGGVGQQGDNDNEDDEYLVTAATPKSKAALRHRVGPGTPAQKKQARLQKLRNRISRNVAAMSLMLEPDEDGSYLGIAGAEIMLPPQEDEYLGVDGFKDTPKMAGKGKGSRLERLRARINAQGSESNAFQAWLAERCNNTDGSEDDNYMLTDGSAVRSAALLHQEPDDEYMLTDGSNATMPRASKQHQQRLAHLRSKIGGRSKAGKGSNEPDATADAFSQWLATRSNMARKEVNGLFSDLNEASAYQLEKNFAGRGRGANPNVQSIFGTPVGDGDLLEFEAWLSSRGDNSVPSAVDHGNDLHAGADDAESEYLITSSGIHGVQTASAERAYNDGGDEYMALDGANAQRARRGLPDYAPEDEYLVTSGASELPKTRVGYNNGGDGDEYMALDGEATSKARIGYNNSKINSSNTNDDEYLGLAGVQEEGEYLGVDDGQSSNPQDDEAGEYLVTSGHEAVPRVPLARARLARLRDRIQGHRNSKESRAFRHWLGLRAQQDRANARGQQPSIAEDDEYLATDGADGAPTQTDEYLPVDGIAAAAGTLEQEDDEYLTTGGTATIQDDEYLPVDGVAAAAAAPPIQDDEYLPVDGVAAAAAAPPIQDDEYLPVDGVGAASAAPIQSVQTPPIVNAPRVSEEQYDALASTWTPGNDYEVGGDDSDDGANEAEDTFTLVDNAIGRNTGSQQSKRGNWAGGSTRDTALRRTQALLSKPAGLLSPREKKALDDMLSPAPKVGARQRNQKQLAAEEQLGTAEFDDLEFLLTAAIGRDDGGDDDTPMTPSRQLSTRKSVRRRKTPLSGLRNSRDGGVAKDMSMPAEFFGTRFRKDSTSSGLELPDRFFGKRQGMTFDFIEEEDDDLPSEMVAVPHTSAPIMSASRGSAADAGAGAGRGEPVTTTWASPAAASVGLGPAVVINEADNSSTLFGSPGLTILRKPSIRRSGKGAPSYLKKFRPFSVVDIESQHGLVDDDDDDDNGDTDGLDNNNVHSDGVTGAQQLSQSGFFPADGDGLKIAESVNDTLSSAMFRPATGRVFGPAKSGRRFGAHIKRMFSGRKKKGSYSFGN